MSEQTQPVFLVLGGLPGTGKTTLAKLLARGLQGVYLRIDTIEQTLLRNDALNDGSEGYLVAYAVAEENLQIGNTVIADSVNPVPATRDAWREIAKRNNARLVEIEIICSNREEHQRRIESRYADLEGHQIPTWNDVINHEYDEWTDKDLTVDTAGQSIGDSLNTLIQKIQEHWNNS